MASNLKLSNTSFTNKDFQEVYPELLEKARDLSYKWDPTVSNESDPGVTIIKEIAIAIDKINYASDKNALETMPLSVTQERTARQLFQLLGYYPKWYISAEADVSMAWKIDQTSEDYETLVQAGERVKIPAFTEIKDDSGDYVYTIPTTTILRADGTIETVKAIQGFVKDLKINNSTTITLDLLDLNNRVYFPDYNVAQNGIFIMSKDAADSNNVSERSFWEQKNNLLIEESGNTFYSFNVDIATNRCYVEFPADISDLIGGGLVIKYLVTTGKDGNSAVGQLNQLYNSQVTAPYVLQPNTQIVLNSENLYIQNTNLNISGKDPESIDDMYDNYNHIKGTFDTIVTLRDYNNAVYNTGEVSNAVVCDRTNDIQQAYRIMASTMDGSENVVYMPQEDNIEEGVKKLSPFGLKVYALQYNDLVDTESEAENRRAYDNTFQMYTDLDVEDPFNIDSSLRQLTLLLNDDRCIQHDFSDIQKNKMCLLKNVAEISMMVFPNVQLTELQKQDVIDSIKNQIYLKYNARKVRFGEEINYDDLFTNILTSSTLIKNISLNQVQYYTYALYYSEGESYNGSPIEGGWKQVCVSDEYDYVDCEPTYDFESGSWSATIGTGDNRTTKDITTKGKNIFFLGKFDSTPCVFLVNSDNKIVPYSSKREEFRKEILVKNILAGITPLFITDSKGFNYAIDEENELHPAVQEMDIETTMPFDFAGESSVRYYPKENEVIQFVRPQLVSELNYGAYVKYDYKGQTVAANHNHRLAANETLVLYYKTEDSDDAPYTRVIYGKGSPSSEFPIICPTFTLNQTTTNVQYLSDATMVPSTTLTCRSGQSIDIKEINEVKLDKNSYVYVIGDEIDVDGIKYYQLKLDKEYADTNYIYYSLTLQGTQQFIYAQDQLSYLNIVGSGTKITVIVPIENNDGESYQIRNKVISTRNISRYGVSALSNAWKKLPYQLKVLAQEFVNVQGSATDTVDKAVDSYIDISSPSASDVKMELDRNGLHYSEGTGTTIQNYTATLNYFDENQVDQVADLEVNKSKLFEFINGDYGESATSDYSQRIEFSPIIYPRVSLNVYINGESETLTGTKTDSYNIDGVEYYYLISGSSLYLVRNDSSGATTQLVRGYPVSLGTAYNITVDSESGLYVVSGVSTLSPGKTIFVIDSAASFGQQIIGDVQTNDSSEASSIGFNLDSVPTSTTKAYIVDYYRLVGIEFDYNSARGNAYKVVDNLSSTSGSDTDYKDNNIVLILSNQSTGVRKAAFLRKASTSQTYPAGTSADGRVKLTRNWQYQNSTNQNSVISESDLLEIADIYSLGISSLDPWNWVPDVSISIVANQDYVGSDNQEVNPSLYSFKYRNRGGEETELILSDEPDMGWKIFGVAYLESENDSPQRIYSNQKLTLYSADEDPVEYSSTDDTAVYAYSSENLYVEGYKKSNVQFIDEDGEITNPQFLISTNKIEDKTYSKDLTDKEIKFTQEYDGDLEYSLPQNEYVFCIRNYTNAANITLSVSSTEGGSLIWLNGETTSSMDLSEKGVYYFKVNMMLATSTVFNLHLTISKNSENDSQINVIIEPMKPLVQPDDSPINSVNQADILDEIKKLSTYKGQDKFNYLYTPPEDKMILNPLRSTSFNNHNHFYNIYTICKVRTYNILGDSNIYISQ